MLDDKSGAYKNKNNVFRSWKQLGKLMYNIFIALLNYIIYI
jgi:hypothetical protein